jgi:hypothetical protein
LRAAAEPDIGSIQPTVLVKVGTTVKLHGIAKRLLTTEQCNIESRLLEFRWSLQSTPSGKLPIDATLDLANDTTLNPSFFAKNPGIYVATLRSIEPSVRQSVEVRIEVLPAGRTWFPIGPNGEAGGDGLAYLHTGRLNALKFDPSNPAVIYASSGMGGLWKSNDRGRSWFTLTDHKGLPTLAIGPVEVASDGTIYVGTGDLYAGSSIFVKGSGIWKSTNGGESWKPAGTVLSGCNGDDVTFTGDATRIVSDPNKPSLVYVASTVGLLRSLNGGQCWTSLFSGMVSDVQMDPSSPTTIYAAMPGKGILRLENASAIPTITTILEFPPPVLWSQLRIAPSNSNTIYVAYAASGSSGTLVKSTDSGRTWPTTTKLACGQCDYNMGLAVDPADANHIIYGEVKPHHSTDGGVTFVDLANDGSAHDDFHELIFAPDDFRWAYSATDGGVYRVFMLGGGQHLPFRNWEPRNVGLSIAQVGQLAAAPTNRSAAAIGVWDNGSQKRLTGRIWSQFQGGDGFNAAFDANSENTIYFNFNAGPADVNDDIRRLPDNLLMESMPGYASNPYRGGELFGVALKSKSDGKLYVLENSNTTNAPAWQCADPITGKGPNVRFIEFHPGGSYFVGYFDGSIVRFRLASPLPDNPKCATDKTAAIGVEKVYSPRIGGDTAMAIDPFSSRSIYAVIVHSGDDPRVLRLTKVGDSWEAVGIDANLPKNAKLSRTVAADPSIRGLVYVGGQTGLWEGLPDQTGSYQWTLNPTVPDTYVSNIVSHRNSNGFSQTVRLGTYGRGVWERVFVEPPCPTKFCMKQPGKLEFCLGCNEPLDPATTTTSPQIDRAVWFTVNYEYTGPQRGLVMRAAPLSNGIAQDFFISSTPVVEPGKHSAILQISYAGVRAPLSLYSEAIRVQIYDRYKHVVLTSRNFSLKNLWVRPEGRIITIGARAGQPGPAPVQTKVLVEMNGRTYGEYVTPTQLAFPTSAKIRIRAATTPNRQEGEEFSVWEVDDTERTTERTISIVLAQDVSLTAVYRPKRSVYQRNAEKKP